MRLDILVRKGVLGLALAGLMTAGVGQVHGKDAAKDAAKAEKDAAKDSAGAQKDTAKAKEANKDVKKNTKQAKVHKTHKPKIKSWRDEIRKGPFG